MQCKTFICHTFSFCSIRTFEINILVFQPVNGNATGDAAGAVHKVVKRKYRQYMNRKGGFNRPLDECK